MESRIYYCIIGIIILIIIGCSSTWNINKGNGNEINNSEEIEMKNDSVNINAKF